jgi:parallel beta-helix repeat protein
LEIYSSGNIIQGLQIINFNGQGIVLCGGSHNTVGGDRGIGIGPLGQGNLTSNNVIGIDLCSHGSYNAITGNIVGTDPTETYHWGNKWNGIFIENGLTNNTIGPDNIIAYNGSVGILIMGTNSFGNTISENSIYNNSFGIRLDGGNTILAHPQISDIDMDAGTVSGSACANCIIEIFSTSSNEGGVYESHTKANSMGTFTYNNCGSFFSDSDGH